MIKNLLFVAGLLSLALASGCATGGSGPGSGPTVMINNTNGITVAGVTLSIPFTVTVTGTTQTAVTWQITGTSCTGSGNPCGTLTNVTSSSVTYVAPAAVPGTPQVAIQATLQSDSSAADSYPLTIVPITTFVAPASLSVGSGLTQQFTAVAVPDNAPQTFTWTCTANGNPCANFTQDPNISGLAYYTAADLCGNACLQISAAATSDPTGCSSGGCTMAKGSVVTSRLTGNGSKTIQFAFNFSGYDSNGKQVLVAGAFAAANGAITSGVEDEIAWNGTQYATTQYAISGGSYTPNTGDVKNSNNSGILALTLPASVYPNTFQAVLDGAGDIEMIESDGHGNGSGIAEAASNLSNFNSGDQTYAFGFTGVDSTGNRVGYAGLMPIDGSGDVAGGQMDINDNGNTTSICGSSPCTIAGSYTYNSSTNTGQVTLTSAVTMDFDFFVANGGTNVNNPLVVYAISTDAVDAQHPAVLGTMVLQDSTKTYNNSALSGTSVAALTGASANVSLTLGTTDGNGNFSGQFDQNNAGTILSAINFPVPGTNTYTYSAGSATNGRYIFQMLGNPNATPVVAPIPFVFYASGVNRGFLLDQSSTSVMTGTMNPQPSKIVNTFAPSELPGTYALATSSDSNSSIASTAYIASNLLLTSPGNKVFNVAGTQNPGALTVKGTYSLNFTSGAGAITLTAPAAKNYVIYMVDLTHFFMIDEDTGVSSPMFFAQE